MGILDLLKGRLKGQAGRGKGLKCLHCGEYIPEGAEKCPRCGTPVAEMYKITCPNCKKEIPYSAIVCPNCGFQFEKTKYKFKCIVCGYEADYDMTQCPVCGTRFV